MRMDEDRSVYSEEISKLETIDFENLRTHRRSIALREDFKERLDEQNERFEKLRRLL